jgi:hypothetical protein
LTLPERLKPAFCRWRFKTVRTIVTGNIQKVNSLVPTYGGLAFDNGRLYAYGSVNNQEEVSPTDGSYINNSNKQLVFDPLQPMGALGYITGAA